MLPDVLAQYLKAAEEAIKGLRDAHVERYEEEIFVDRRVNLRIRVRFAGGHLLELTEAVSVVGEETPELSDLGYRYHFQDELRSLIFRYDNTPHFPGLDSFPHHKHVGDTVVSSHKPTIPEVVQEMKGFLQVR